MLTVLQLPPRLPGWPEHLAWLVEQRRRAPFEWGVNDCASFAADAVLAMTGADPLGGLRGAWASHDEAQALLASMGGLAAAAENLLGPSAADGRARRGSIVCAHMEGQEIMGVMLSGSLWCAPGPRGIVFRPRAEVVAAWNL